MILLPPSIRLALRTNHVARRAAVRREQAEPDPLPVLKLFNPLGAATWLATELCEDGDTLFGLADLGFGCPELGYFSLSEIAKVRLPFGLGIERDEGFVGLAPLSRWAAHAREGGSIIAAERALRRQSPELSSRLPPGPSPEGAQDHG
ncbi:DUF2958 domain-containing protein [Novosphingobium cyanobacteriorum]|uniref:DUF2958 domain-containing protein n=1 Tax=Novosphingobium cyanobacteriorum TaxID=3024215 RepID=A0ABT6CLJ1_9SPHN|nr:DUF2958 domain-containing protein [Novosphingobium cyanobacteriorum]MDF8334790.1 DUF2958 domain-containing protein [Novosphingobium cyanobacteriorum]